jgi:beta-glucosidase
VWYPGEEVVQLYVSDLEASVDAPISSLRGFGRVRLEPGESWQISFSIIDDILKIADEEGNFILEPGEFKITIGGASPGARSLELGAPKPAEFILSVR